MTWTQWWTRTGGMAGCLRQLFVSCSRLLTWFTRVARLRLCNGCLTAECAQLLLSIIPLMGCNKVADAEHTLRFADVRNCMPWVQPVSGLEVAASADLSASHLHELYIVTPMCLPACSTQKSCILTLSASAGTWHLPICVGDGGRVAQCDLLLLLL